MLHLIGVRPFVEPLHSARDVITLVVHLAQDTIGPRYSNRRDEHQQHQNGKVARVSPEHRPKRSVRALARQFGRHWFTDAGTAGARNCQTKPGRRLHAPAEDPKLRSNRWYVRPHNTERVPESHKLSHHSRCRSRSSADSRYRTRTDCRRSGWLRSSTLP